MVVWVGGDPASPAHLQAQQDTRKYLERQFQEYGKDNPLLRKVAGLFSPTRGRARGKHRAH